MNLKEQLSEELYEKLEVHAYEVTTPFCYSCYKDAPKGVCSSCHSDDLMRHLPGVGVEYGIEWVMKSIIEEHFTPLGKEAKESLLEGVYPEETNIGWLKYDTLIAIKILDPISFEIAIDEQLSCLKEDQQLFEIGDYYWTHDLESFLDSENTFQSKGA